ncbi:UDP-N-acetyl glucosamine 2-epimerase [Prevotella aurantiaca]|jgi:UDP-N-acetylglucosamine 2-epimerase|uniref:UDP-N-acetyl glucosamine 2-epimerase n=1 Tax=Prevotella aurantiaca TaxID=596085 RepID=A0A930HNN4_9BACT|nr:UDP-N-acetyl glucosamine 2-epimerase [Prevotella aurantiaca]MBF1384937.1 UDP-N-acetyl glucosamine 2-epimerase [Prevotella aurantiaca]
MTKINSELKICIFCGARPNFMKVAPIIRILKKKHTEGWDGRNIAYSLVYAGSENDPTLENSLFEDLQIPRPNVYLGVECENLNELTGQVMSKFEQYLQQNNTHVVVVVDDLASTMAAAIVAKKQGIALAHIAAGTRSFDINMPKEINRLVIDGLSDVLFTAGLSNNSIANKEGAELSRVYMVGNILIDNIRFNRERMGSLSLENIHSVSNLHLKTKQYLVFTLNRKMLMNNKENLGRMLKAMLEAAGDMPIVAPLRENAAQVVRSLDLSKHTNLNFVEPLGYLEFSFLLSNAAGIVTDSGNVAEEATFTNVPCATLNSYTEHIETVKQGTNILVGEDAQKLHAVVSDMVEGRWKATSIPDRWDGRSAERIVQTLVDLVK